MGVTYTHQQFQVIQEQLHQAFMERDQMKIEIAGFHQVKLALEENLRYEKQKYEFEKRSLKKELACTEYQLNQNLTKIHESEQEKKSMKRIVGGPRKR